MKIRIYQAADAGWRWSAIEANGRIVADGAEGYDSKGNAERAVRNVLGDIERGEIEIEVETATHPRAFHPAAWHDTRKVNAENR